MKLDKTLNFKKVRCVKGYDDCLEIGKEYDVIDVSVEIKVKDDEGEFLYWESDYFEPVVDDELPKSAENPLKGVELMPEFEAVEPTFKVGDKVYVGLTGKIAQVTKIIDDDVVNVANKNNEVRAWISNICHATPENYEMLCKLYPHIKFEAPPKPLTGSDLARAMLDKGWKYVPCYISDSSDTHALERQTRNAAVIIGTHKDHPSFFIYGSGKSFIYYAVPFDPRTGEPLSESVLDEQKNCQAHSPKQPPTLS